MDVIKFTKDNLKYYDFDAEQPYAPGAFNQKYKTHLNDKTEIIEQEYLKDSQIIESFLNGEYKTVRTTKPIYLYRIYGQFRSSKEKTIKGASEHGAFASTEFAESTIEAKQRLALDPSWLSTKMYEAKILVPVGTVLNIGIVAPVTTRGGSVLPGGADQVLLPKNWPESWIVGYRRVHLSQIQSEPIYSLDKISVINDKSSLYPHHCPICGSVDIIIYKDEDAIQFVCSKGCKYRAHYRCSKCSLFW